MNDDRPAKPCQSKRKTLKRSPSGSLINEPMIWLFLMLKRSLHLNFHNCRWIFRFSKLKR